MADPSHAHCFVPGIDPASPPLVLLHGSGGDERALLPLAGELAPGAARLGLRGTVAIDGGYAFFRRFPDRRVDEADIAARSPALAQAIDAATGRYGVTSRPVAIGFSNGAIMAAALLLTHPSLFQAAVLLRPLSPFTHDPPHRLNGTPVLIIDGQRDARRSPGDGAQLAARLKQAGALVTHHVLPTGHALTAEDERIASVWLGSLAPRPPVASQATSP